MSACFGTRRQLAAGATRVGGLSLDGIHDGPGKALCVAVGGAVVT